MANEFKKGESGKRVYSYIGGGAKRRDMKPEDIWQLFRRVGWA